MATNVQKKSKKNLGHCVCSKSKIICCVWISIQYYCACQTLSNKFWGLFWPPLLSKILCVVAHQHLHVLISTCSSAFTRFHLCHRSWPAWQQAHWSSWRCWIQRSEWKLPQGPSLPVSSFKIHSLELDGTVSSFRYLKWHFLKVCSVIALGKWVPSHSLAQITYCYYFKWSYLFFCLRVYYLFWR